jgi:hypothetical protein
MKDGLLPHWISNGWVAPWDGRLGCFGGSADNSPDIFGHSISCPKPYTLVSVVGINCLDEYWNALRPLSIAFVEMHKELNGMLMVRWEECRIS